MFEITSLNVSYGARRVLNEVSLRVAPGEVVALIGPNGAGKSTLIRAASGIIKVDSGSVRFGETDLLALNPPERARLLAVVPQASQMGGAFTVEQAVMMGRTAYLSWLGKPGESDWRIVNKAMENTSTESLAQRRIAELSGGEQQRVLLARALAQETPFLLLDEPTNHLDLQHISTLLSLVRKLAKEQGIAVLMALHDLNLVSYYADKAALLVGGELVAFGEPGDVLTVETINQAYQAEIEVLIHPESKTPIILHRRANQ